MDCTAKSTVLLNIKFISRMRDILVETGVEVKFAARAHTGLGVCIMRPRKWDFRRDSFMSRHDAC
jgi:hypothetical protein